MLSFLMHHSSLLDEEPDDSEQLPEVELPGLDPFLIARNNGELPDRGILLDARIMRLGSAIFHVYDYDKLDVQLKESLDGTSQSLELMFRYNKQSPAKELDFAYEQPNYFDRDTEPCQRTGQFNYLALGWFKHLDTLDLVDNGRLLISRHPRPLSNLATGIRQTQWRTNMLITGAFRNIGRWFPPSQYEEVSKATEMIARDLMGVDQIAAAQIQTSVSAHLEMKRQSLA